MPSRSRFRPLSRFASAYPLITWMGVAFLLLHTGLRGVLMGQTWEAAQMAPASEQTRFMGRSVLRAYPDAGRAFIATYQKLGYLTPDRLVVLSPGRQIEAWQLNAQQDIGAPERRADTLAVRAIGAYQETARRARDGLLRHVNLADGLRMR